MLSEQDTKTWPLSAAIETFLADKHIATLTTLRADGTPHVVPVSFSWDRETRLVRILAGIESRKVKNLIEAPGSRVAVCQADGRVWVTLEGIATVSEDPQRVAEGRRRYIERYRRPGAGLGNGGPGGPGRGPGGPGGPGGGGFGGPGGPGGGSFGGPGGPGGGSFGGPGGPGGGSFGGPGGPGGGSFGGPGGPGGGSFGGPGGRGPGGPGGGGLGRGGPGGGPGGPGGGGPGPGPMGNGIGRRAQGRDPLDSWQAVIEIAIDRVMSRNL